MENKIDKDTLIKVYENKLNKTTTELVYQQAQSATLLGKLDELDNQIVQLEETIHMKDVTIEELIDSKSRLECELNRLKEVESKQDTIISKESYDKLAGAE